MDEECILLLKGRRCLLSAGFHGSWLSVECLCLSRADSFWTTHDCSAQLSADEPTSVHSSRSCFRGSQ